MGILGGILGAIPIVGGLYTGIKGIVDNGKANTALDAANGMQRGHYDIQPEFTNNYNRAGLNSLTGIPAAQRAFQQQNIMRSAANGLNASNLTRNSSAAIGNLQQNENDQYNQLMAQDAAARQQNQQYLNQAGSELGNQRVNQNMYNNNMLEGDRSRALGQAQQAKAAAQANITNGFASAIGSVAGLATGGLSTLSGGLLGGGGQALPQGGSMGYGGLTGIPAAPRNYGPSSLPSYNLR